MGGGKATSDILVQGLVSSYPLFDGNIYDLSKCAVVSLRKVNNTRF